MKCNAPKKSHLVCLQRQPASNSYTITTMAKARFYPASGQQPLDVLLDGERPLPRLFGFGDTEMITMWSNQLGDGTFRLPHVHVDLMVHHAGDNSGQPGNPHGGGGLCGDAIVFACKTTDAEDEPRFLDWDAVITAQELDALLLRWGERHTRFMRSRRAALERTMMRVATAAARGGAPQAAAFARLAEQYAEINGPDDKPDLLTPLEEEESYAVYGTAIPELAARLPSARG